MSKVTRVRGTKSLQLNLLRTEFKTVYNLQATTAKGFHSSFKKWLTSLKTKTFKN